MKEIRGRRGHGKEAKCRKEIAKNAAARPGGGGERNRRKRVLNVSLSKLAPIALVLWSAAVAPAAKKHNWWVGTLIDYQEQQEIYTHGVIEAGVIEGLTGRRHDPHPVTAYYLTIRVDSGDTDLVFKNIRRTNWNRYPKHTVNTPIRYQPACWTCKAQDRWVILDETGRQHNVVLVKSIRNQTPGDAPRN